jgi:hypothetical protein
MEGIQEETQEGTQEGVEEKAEWERRAVGFLFGLS